MIEESSDFCCVGAYPTGAEPDLKYGTPEEKLLADQNISLVPIPLDPVYGTQGPVGQKWKWIVGIRPKISNIYTPPLKLHLPSYICSIPQAPKFVQGTTAEMAISSLGTHLVTWKMHNGNPSLLRLSLEPNALWGRRPHAQKWERGSKNVDLFT